MYPSFVVDDEPRGFRVVRTEPRPLGAARSLPKTQANFDTNDRQRTAFPHDISGALRKVGLRFGRRSGGTP